MNQNDNAGHPPLSKQVPESQTPLPTTLGLAPGLQQPYVNGKKHGGEVTMCTALEFVLQRWHWLLVGVIVGAGCGLLAGWGVVKPKYTASAQLLRFEIPGKSEYFKTTPLSGETFAGLIRSPEILNRVGQQLKPPVPAYTLSKWVKVDPEPDSDLVRIMGAATSPEYAVNLVNLYASNAVEVIREQDARQVAALAEDYLKKQVTEMDEDIANLENQFRGLPFRGLDTNRLARLGGKVSELKGDLASGPRPSVAGFGQQAQRLQTAMQELNDLLQKYKEAHPAVQAKQEYINDLKRSMAAARTNGTAADLPFFSAPGKIDGTNPDIDIIHIKLRAVEDARVDLAKRQREAELYALNKPASVRVFAPAEVKAARASMRSLKVGILALFGGMAGLCAAIGLALLAEFIDNRLKTADDVERVTKLPVLTTLGDLHEMRPQDRNQWAFRAWTMLQGRLSPSPNHGLICGITSAVPGEGRSTWISLLAEAASLTGYRVLTIATRPSPTHVKANGDFKPDAGSDDEPAPTNGHSNALTSNVLATPAKITEELSRPNSQPVVHIPLPGWVWNLERRAQWREALIEWNHTENLVILVELPPASVPEAVLLGSNLPNMLWLTNSGGADATETRAHLETLRHARCNLVGAVLNRARGASLRSRFPRWVGLGILFAAACLSTSNAQDTAPSQEPVPAPIIQAPPEQEQDTSPTNRSFSIVQPSQRAAWQQHMTLGPGDVLTLNLYGQPELVRTEVAIGPDGRISYLEAQDVVASGLTIDELRTRLDQQIAQFRRAPRTLITPVLFKSKKYYMLGKVATKGVYVLDRPLTMLEALARAHGFESALVDRNIYDLADYQHSFLAREGKRIPLDFEKLFQQGDLSQNIAIEPGDYIYFAPTDVNEVYVLGEVRLPGPVTYNSDLTIIGAIAGRGGYTDRAYKAKVVVVRGPLGNPQKFIVNTHAILDAKGPDFRLQPRDIIFVNSRPFIKVEELADLAATAFIQSVITSAVGVDVVTPINP